jgi:ABC-type Fe3+/spermidine/putrescine transport system ATPase subunit
LDLSREPHEHGFDNMAPARIDKALYNGSDMHYWLRLTDQTIWTARVVNARGHQKEFVPGESVYVRWNAIDGVAVTE